MQVQSVLGLQSEVIHPVRCLDMLHTIQEDSPPTLLGRVIQLATVKEISFWLISP